MLMTKILENFSITNLNGETTNLPAEHNFAAVAHMAALTVAQISEAQDLRTDQAADQGWFAAAVHRSVRRTPAGPSADRSHPAERSRSAVAAMAPAEGSQAWSAAAGGHNCPALAAAAAVAGAMEEHHSPDGDLQNAGLSV